MARTNRMREGPPADDETGPEAEALPEIAAAEVEDAVMASDGDMRIEVIAIADLHPDPANVRRHPERNMSVIKASLARFGQMKPIVIDANNVVRAGNGTLEAARELGWASINCVRSGPCGADMVAYSITDNRSAELAEWNFEGLGETIRALQAEDFDISVLGWQDHELEPIFGNPASGPIPEGADGKEYDESIADEVEYLECPSCGHKFPK